MSWLITLIVSLVRALLPWVVSQSRPTAVDADPDRNTREKLKVKIRRHWMPLVLIPLLITPGCAVRTVYVPHGTPVRLRETVPDVKVWVKDDRGETVAGRMDLYEGWYALPLDDQP